MVITKEQFDIEIESLESQIRQAHENLIYLRGGLAVLQQLRALQDVELEPPASEIIA